MYTSHFVTSCSYKCDFFCTRILHDVFYRTKCYIIHLSIVWNLPSIFTTSKSLKTVWVQLNKTTTNAKVFFLATNSLHCCHHYLSSHVKPGSYYYYYLLLNHYTDCYCYLSNHAYSSRSRYSRYSHYII